MRINRSGHIHRHESVTVERATCVDCTDDTFEPLLGKKTFCVDVATETTYSFSLLTMIKRVLSKCNILRGYLSSIYVLQVGLIPLQPHLLKDCPRVDQHHFWYVIAYKKLVLARKT